MQLHVTLASLSSKEVDSELKFEFELGSPLTSMFSSSLTDGVEVEAEAKGSSCSSLSSSKDESSFETH